MANLNLSEFGEKLFVTDADHTFIWDTVNAISKRVSRNSWLNSGTLTSDAPVTISQTWGNNLVTFTGLRFNAAGTSATNSAAGSVLFDLQVGGATKVSVNKDGAIGGYAYNGLNTSGGGTMQVASGNATFGYHMARDYCVTWGGAATLNGSIEVSLCRDGAANTLALRNGANAQTFNVYGTYTSGASYARLAIACDTSGNATLTTQSTGVAGTVSINGVPVGLGKGNVSTNVAVGTGALNANVTGANNTIIGKDALLNSTAGTWNVIIGSNASKATLGVNNYTTVVGAQAMENCVTSSYNSAFGQGAGYFISTGGNLTSSQNSVFLGALSRPLGNVETNQIVIGFEAVGIGSNSVVLGNDSITKTALKGNVGIGTTAPSTKLDVVGNGRFVGDYPYVAIKPNAWADACYIQSNLNSTSGAVGVYTCFLNPAAHGFGWHQGSTSRMSIDTAGNVGIGTTSPSSKLHVAGDVTLPNAGSIFFGGGFNIYGTTTATTINGPTTFGQVGVSVNGVTKWVFNYDGLLCGGGTTAAFPALKRSSTTLQSRLADDTAFAPIQGKLTTDTAFTATTVTPTGFITLYDSTGTAYKVPCVPA